MDHPPRRGWPPPAYRCGPRSHHRYPHLREYEPGGLGLRLELALNGHNPFGPPYAEMYWSAAQMLSHMTPDGACVRTVILFASGPVSGPDASQRGSVIELAWNGAEPARLPDESSWSFLEGGDLVTVSGFARGPAGSPISLARPRPVFILRWRIRNLLAGWPHGHRGGSVSGQACMRPLPRSGSEHEAVMAAIRTPAGKQVEVGNGPGRIGPNEDTVAIVGLAFAVEVSRSALRPKSDHLRSQT